MTLTTILSFVSLSAIIGGFIYVGRKLRILDDLKATSDKMKGNLKVISDFLTKNQTEFNPSELQALSPLQLTDAGEKLISDLNFKEVFTDHKSDFFACIDTEHPKVKYDVEIASIKAIYMLVDKPYMQFLKVFFYNNPNRNLEDTAPTLGIYVRNEYLAIHPEIVQ